jgi:hypothetical protein
MHHCWNEAEVYALAGESSDFDRKSGQLRDESEFRRSFAKALSAFANSGGGHIFIGVEDDGRPLGIRNCPKGRQSAREWIETMAAGLTDYPIQAINVQVVQPSMTDSSIPAEHCVLSVTIGDSELAPHQSSVDHIYYMRQAGRSLPASNRSLELLRYRPARAVLEIVHVRIDVLKAALQSMSVADCMIAVEVLNTSRTVTANAARVPIRLTGPHLKMPVSLIGMSSLVPVLPGADCTFRAQGSLGMRDHLRTNDPTRQGQELPALVSDLMLAARATSDTFCGVESAWMLNELDTFIDGRPLRLDH